MILWDRTWVVVDTETTGLDIQTAGICEIAARYFQQGQIQPPKLGMLIHPGHPIPAEATAIHGITDAMVATAPRMEAVLANFVRRIADADIVVAYNGYGYDLPLLAVVAERVGMLSDWKGVLESRPTIDPYIMIRSIAADERWKGSGTRKLTSACERFGIVVDGPAHRAGADCEMTGKLLWHIGQHYDYDWLDLGAFELEAELRRMKTQQDAEFEAWKSRQQG